MQTSGTTASLVLLKWLPAVRTVPVHLNSTHYHHYDQSDLHRGRRRSSDHRHRHTGEHHITAVTNSTTATISHAATATSTTNVTITVTETASAPRARSRDQRDLSHLPGAVHDKFRLYRNRAAYRYQLVAVPRLSNDTIYVGGDNGFVHKYTGVFLGTPTEVTSGFPAQAAVVALSEPRVQSGLRNGLRYRFLRRDFEWRPAA